MTAIAKPCAERTESIFYHKTYIIGHYFAQKSEAKNKNQ